MPQIILVGVDGSDSSRRAAETAASLAASTGATLHVMMAAEDRDRPSEAQYVGDVRIQSRAEAIATEIADSLTGTTPNVQASPAHGKPADALVQVATDIGADLIVVGNRRVQGIGRLLGSVAADVAQHAPCDVYIVKTV
jgi:nucleotide-binding universal stress UspA family protein